MVLKRQLFTFGGIFLLLCMTNNIYAQVKEKTPSKSWELFQNLEQARDSAQYAHELFSIAQYCRQLGMYEESKIAVIQAEKIFSKVLRNRTFESEEDYALYEEELAVQIFLLDLLIGRGDSYLALSLRNLDLDVSTTAVLTYTMYNYARKGASKKELRSIYERLEFPRLDQLDIVTRYYWETGKTDQVIKEINKAKRKSSWVSLPEHKQRIMSRRLENACLLPSLSLSTLNECLRIAKSMYYPVSVRDILREQKLPEYFSMYREAARICVKNQKPLYALKVYSLIERLIIKTIGDDFSFLLRTEQHELWEIMKPYFEEMQTFAYANHALEGMVPFLYRNHLLMKELFEKVSFQYHRYLSEANSRYILNTQSLIDSITFANNSFKNSASQDTIKQLHNQIVHRELEKSLINHVKKEVSPQIPKINQWNEIAASLDSNEAVIEIFSLPYELIADIHIAIVFTKKQAPRLITLPSESSDYRDNEIVYNKFWIPIKEVIGDCTYLYVSSLETSHFLPFANIHNKDKYMIDEYDIHYLFSSNDIPQIKAKQKQETFGISQKRDLFLFGGADFNYHPSCQEAIQGFQYLQGTVDELRSIENILSNQWSIHKYTGKDATEVTFRKLSGQSFNSSVIHIATHSFRIIHHPKAQSGVLHAKGLSKYKEPLLHTGLVFAGANHTWENLQQLKTDDGILTSLEIESMNLSGVDLIVLSSCNAGNGDTLYGEGIFSLQRAFRQAGVKSQIIAFQDVPDKETKELMIDFYRYWQARVNKQKAFIMAQRNMKNKYPNEPNKWASFILIE